MASPLQSCQKGVELMDIGLKGRTVSTDIPRRKIYPLICCNIFLVIIKFCYGNMSRQTCIHTTCPSMTKSAIEVIPRKQNDAKIKSKPETIVQHLFVFWDPEIRNPAPGIRNSLAWGDPLIMILNAECNYWNVSVDQTSIEIFFYRFREQNLEWFKYSTRQLIKHSPFPGCSTTFYINWIAFLKKRWNYMYENRVDGGFYELWKELPITVIFSSIIHYRMHYLHKASNALGSFLKLAINRLV